MSKENNYIFEKKLPKIMAYFLIFDSFNAYMLLHLIFWDMWFN